MLFARLLLLAVLTLTGVPATTRPVVMRDLHGTARPVPAPRARATVLFFIAHDCPIANSYAPEIRRIAADYSTRNVAFYLVYVEPGLSVTAARQHVAAYGYHLPALRDTRHVLVKQFGALVTPEAVVLAPDAHILYRGRIDDRYFALGQARFHVDRHDLRAALDAVLAGNPVPTPTTRAVGCFIPPLG